MMNEILKTIMEPITYENINELEPGDWIWDNMPVEKRAHERTPINRIEDVRITEPYGFRQIHIMEKEPTTTNTPFALSTTAIPSYANYEWVFFEDGKDRFYKFKNNTSSLPANDDLVKKRTEDTKDRLYNSLMVMFDKLDSLKHDLSWVYEGISKDLDIMESNNKEDRYRELLFEILELTRNKLCSSGEFDDWKDTDNWLFSKLSLTKSELADVYRGRSIVYIESVKEDANGKKYD